MPSDLSSYLATNYLTADPKPTKKRKRKQPAATTGLLIQDEDDSWGNPKAQNDDEDGPAVVSGTSAEFRKSKKSNWKSVGAGSSTSTAKDDTTAAADAILASAAKESEAMNNSDEAPIIEPSSSSSQPVVKMSDGTHAGLQSAAAVSAQLKLRQQEELASFERHRKSAKEEETVYRDATGRRIDISMKRAEARREAEAKERQAKEALMGDKQLAEAARRREMLSDAKLMKFARTADDEEMNDELKDKERWNDPMNQFMAEKKTVKKKGIKGRPVYSGAAVPNRYGIRPGYRWDGVDRSNGFEGERFKAFNRREMNKGLSYEWQMDE